ncbi:MAG: chromate resistance protein ChrB domain-containing protein [candidate division WOR-3 bacterium]
MKWVTRTRVHVDRVACPWLIRRFVDAQAEFLFVTSNLVSDMAQEEGAIPFDVKGAELAHHDGHCTFVSIINKYGLKDPALLALAEVVNAADLGKFDENPYAAGLEAIASGFSHTFPDDWQSVEAQFGVYDALYAFFRSKVTGAK